VFRVDATLVLVVGPEELLAERAVTKVVSAARTEHPATEVIEIEGAGYESGSVGVHASPSLFAEPKVLVIRGLEDANEALVADLLGYLDAPASDVTLVLCHRSGVRAKKVLEAARQAGAEEIECPAIKSDRDKTDFVIREFRAAARQIAPEAVRLWSRRSAATCGSSRARVPSWCRTRPGGSRPTRCSSTTGARSRRPASGWLTRRSAGGPARRSSC
jgi:DNA polymerase III delta subunit